MKPRLFILGIYIRIAIDITLYLVSASVFPDTRDGCVIIFIHLTMSITGITGMATN